MLMNNVLGFGNLGTTEILIILLILFLLFGAKKLPELARGIGKSLGEFKKAKSDFENELMNSDQPKKNDQVSPTLPPQESKPADVTPVEPSKEEQKDNYPPV